MKFKQYLNEARNPKQVKKEWDKAVTKRQNLLAIGKSKEYKKARKRELELAHEYWKLTGFTFQGLGQMPFENTNLTESNLEDFDMLNGIRLSFNIRIGNEFFLSLDKQNTLSDKQIQTAKNILKKTREVKKLIKMAKSMTWEEALKFSTEKLSHGRLLPKDVRNMRYYSLLSSPLHHELLRNM